MKKMYDVQKAIKEWQFGKTTSERRFIYGEIDGKKAIVTDYWIALVDETDFIFDTQKLTHINLNKVVYDTKDYTECVLEKIEKEIITGNEVATYTNSTYGIRVCVNYTMLKKVFSENITIKASKDINKKSMLLEVWDNYLKKCIGYIMNYIPSKKGSD